MSGWYGEVRQPLSLVYVPLPQTVRQKTFIKGASLILRFKCLVLLDDIVVVDVVITAVVMVGGAAVVPKVEQNFCQ